MTRIVLHTRTGAHLAEQLDVVERALFEPLGFQHLACEPQLGETGAELLANALDRLLQALARGHVVARGVDAVALDPPEHAAAHWIDLADALDRVVEELHTHRALVLVDREHLYDVAAHPERPAMKIVVAADGTGWQRACAARRRGRSSSPARRTAAARSTPPESPRP
jgi:hypothetical protein